MSHTVNEIDGRIPVSVEFAFENPQFTYWRFDKESREFGLECWRHIDCDLDKLTHEIGYILFGKKVQRGHIVYMQPPAYTNG